MRSAWKVRLAGCPPVRRVAAGIDERTSSASRAVPVNGSRARSRTTASAIRRANRSSPYSRSTRASSVGRVGVDDLGRGDAPALVHPHVQRRVLGVGEAAGGLVELQRRDPEVEQHALHPRGAEPGEHRRRARRRRRAPGWRGRRTARAGRRRSPAPAGRGRARPAGGRRTARAAPRCGRPARGWRPRRRRRAPRRPARAARGCAPAGPARAPGRIPWRRTPGSAAQPGREQQEQQRE